MDAQISMSRRGHLLSKSEQQLSMLVGELTPEVPAGQRNIQLACC